MRVLREKEKNMSNAEIAAWELDKKLDGRSLHYKIEDAPHCENHNERSFDTIKEMLERVGVNLEKDDDSLFISINSQKYAAAARTYAGRGRRFAYPENGYKAYTYSDIVYMLNSMSNDEVASKIDMPIATFYRHKKRLINSDYYKALDTSRLNDIEYLKSCKNSDICF